MSDNSDTGFDSDGGDDEVVEYLEEHGEKRKHADDEEGEQEKKMDGKKRRKLRKENLQKKYHKPPTAEELNQLKETENLFHSNLFRLQVEEMLKEIQIKEKHKKLFTAWFEKFESWLLKMEDSEQVHELKDISWLKKMKMKLPISVPRYNLKGRYQFKKPAEVVLVGSYSEQTYIGPKVTIDVLVVMPQKFFEKSDYLNLRYHKKRALYMCEVAHHIEFVGHLVDDIHFVCDESDRMHPLLELKPAGKLGKHVTVHLRPVPENGTFKLLRFAPSKSNLRGGWFFNEDDTEGEAIPTPAHNSSILSDLVAYESNVYISSVLTSKPSVCEGLKLIKIWLRQRELECEVTGYGTAMLIAYLLHARRISHQMSSYQVLRSFCAFLTSPDLEQGLTLCETSSDPHQPTLAEFTSHHAVVLVDTSGYHNALSQCSRAGLNKLRHEARLALACLDTPNLTSFHALFMTRVPFYRHYDHIVSFKSKDCLDTLADLKATRAEKLNHCGIAYNVCREMVHKVLTQGLGGRVRHVHVEQPATSRWSPHSKPRSVPTLRLGLSLDPEACLSLVDKAAGEDLTAAEEFRSFWGSKSELRRFKDGSITEAVVWQAATLAEKRLITRQIVLYLFKTKLNVAETDVSYCADELAFVDGSACEESLKVVEVLDSLSKQLRELQGLPLSIVSVQGVSPVLRYTEVAPPVQHPPHRRVKEEECPPWVAPVDAVLQLGASNKWPRDLDAVRRIRAAFNINIAKVLTDECGLPCQPHQNGFEVLKDGYLFRLSVFYPGEVALLKQSKDAAGMVKYLETAASAALEKKHVHLPKLSSALHGLYTQHSSYGPACRLVKRWVRAHLLDTGHVTDEALELLMACVYLRPEPEEPPCQPQTAFLRFLHLVSTTNWNSTCIILNINNELTREEVVETEQLFNANRLNLPSVFIATPHDRSRSIWTEKTLNPLILLRLVDLSTATLTTLETSILTSQVDHQALLKPSLAVYDVVLHVSSAFNPRRFTSRPGGVSKAAAPRKTIPVAGFNPVELYVSELRAAYEDVALFFYDLYGGNVVTVLWKPTALAPCQFKTSLVNGRTWGKDKKQLVLNQAAILDDFALIGRGLVTKVDVKTNGGFVSHYVG